MRKLVIVKPNCYRLENHLWNYLSIYAYGLESNTAVLNPSFSQWHRYFNLYKKESLATRIVSFIPFFHFLWKIIGAVWGGYLVRAHKSCVRLTMGTIDNLPPTRPESALDSCQTTYFVGWLFRNPIGLERHRDALIAAFTPRETILKDIETRLAPLRGKRLIGVHIRQQPYKGFEDKPFIVHPERVRAIVDEYLRENQLTAEEVALVTVSDTYDVTSLFLLSKCSVVIGTNSTFSNLAAWFGNVPHIVATNEPVDWDYYRDRQAYFQNKYATFAQ